MFHMNHVLHDDFNKQVGGFTLARIDLKRSLKKLIIFYIN